VGVGSVRLFLDDEGRASYEARPFSEIASIQAPRLGAFRPSGLF